MTEQEKMAREIVKKWVWDCGDSLSLSFVQSELLQQRIVEAHPPTAPAPCERPVELGQRHPRFPSGWCVECGATPEGGCLHETDQAMGWKLSESTKAEIDKIDLNIRRANDFLGHFCDRTYPTPCKERSEIVDVRMNLMSMLRRIRDLVGNVGRTET